MLVYYATNLQVCSSDEMSLVYIKITWPALVAMAALGNQKI